MIHWRRTTDVWPVEHTKNLCSICHFYIITNYQKMTNSQDRSQQAEKMMSNITERALREEISQLQKEIDNDKAFISWLKQYIGKIFSNDPKQVKVIALAQAIVEHVIPIDDNKAKIDEKYRYEMLTYRWHLALGIEEFCNDFVEKLSDKKFRNEMLNYQYKDK